MDFYALYYKKSDAKAVGEFRKTHSSDSEWVKTLLFEPVCDFRVPYIHKIWQLGGKEAIVEATQSLSLEHKKKVLLANDFLWHTTLDEIIGSGDVSAPKTVYTLLKGSTSGFLDSVLVVRQPNQRQSTFDLVEKWTGKNFQNVLRLLYGEAAVLQRQGKLAEMKPESPILAP